MLRPYMPNHLLFIYNNAAFKVIIKEEHLRLLFVFVLKSKTQPLDHLINGVHLNSTLELVIVVGISMENETFNQNPNWNCCYIITRCIIFQRRAEKDKLKLNYNSTHPHQSKQPLGLLTAVETACGKRTIIALLSATSR